MGLLQSSLLSHTCHELLPAVKAQVSALHAWCTLTLLHVASQATNTTMLCMLCMLCMLTHGGHPGVRLLAL